MVSEFTASNPDFNEAVSQSSSEVTAQPQTRTLALIDESPGSTPTEQGAKQNHLIILALLSSILLPTIIYRQRKVHNI